MTADPPQQPDEGLEDEGLEHVRSRCEGFYREPSIGAYFNTRLAVLAAVNEHREQFVTWANEGVSFHDLRIMIPSVESDDDTSEPPSANTDPLQWYIQTETISLQHHALGAELGYSNSQRLKWSPQRSTRTSRRSSTCSA